MFFYKSDIENIKFFTQNAFSYISVEHDFTKKVYDEIDNDEKSKLTIINLDQHSDVYINTPHQPITSSNWVNFILLDNKIKSFYWIFPDDILQRDRNKTQLLEDVGPYYLKDDNSFNERFLLDREAKEILTLKKLEVLKNNCNEFSIKDFYADKSLERFELQICKLKHLKPIKKPVFVSIDADFFSSKDADASCFNLFYKFRLYKSISYFLKVMRLLEIQPDYITMTYSPKYMRIGDYKTIENFFNLIKLYSVNK